MIFRRKTLSILLALAFASGSLIACGGTDDPVLNHLANQNDENGGQNNDENGGQNNDENGGQNNDENGGQNNDENGGQNNDENGGQNNDKNGDQNNDENGGNNQTDPPPANAPNDLLQVLITEIMLSPKGISPAQGQWLELYNGTNSPLDLKGCAIEAFSSFTGPGQNTTFLIEDSLRIEPGEYKAIANGANPGFSPDHVLSNMSFASEFGQIWLLCGEELISVVTYDDGAYFPVVEGASMVFDPAMAGVLGQLGFADEPFLFCEGTQNYNASNKGQPGAADPVCPWMEEDSAQTIAQIKQQGSGTLSPKKKVSNVLVTLASSSAGGFFVQASDDGPAIFVAQDPAPLGLRTGMLISFDATAVTTGNEGTHISAIDTSSVEILRLFIPAYNFGLTTELDATPDLLTNLNRYEHMLFEGLLTLTGDVQSSGAGYAAYVVETAHNFPAGDVLLRGPATLIDDLGLSSGCQIYMYEVPLWRHRDRAQFGLWNPLSIELGPGCAAPQLTTAQALDSTTIRVTFNRLLRAVAADGSDFQIDGLDILSASVDGRDVTLKTAPQTSGASYTIRPVQGALLDIYGNAVSNTVNFAGYTPYTPLKLAITEIMPKYQGGTNDPGEFIELTNVGLDAINLGDCTLSNPSRDTPLPANLILQPRERALFTATPGGDAGLDEDGLIDFALGNNGTTLTVTCDNEVMDSMTYTGAHVADGRSFQKDRNLLDKPNPAGGLAAGAWCLTPLNHEYATGGDGDPRYGTPGAANVNCP